MEPHTLAIAQRLARLYEAKLVDIKASQSASSITRSLHHTHEQEVLTKTPFRQLSSRDHRERRAQGLCFSYDEKWSRSHVCKKPIMAILASPVHGEEVVVDDISSD
ncbi:hypothetical protein ACLB2K_001877 [Fragaria x ananassa]